MMKKNRFIASIKTFGWIILATLISLATISLLDELDTKWFRFLVVMTLTKVIWYCLEQARWTWGVYVNKKINNMYINNCIIKRDSLSNTIGLHNHLYQSKPPNKDSKVIDINKTVDEAVKKSLDEYFKNKEKESSNVEVIEIKEVTDND